MKFAVDRIEGDIAVLENIETKEKKEERLSSLPSNTHEQAILIYENGFYSLSVEEELSRKEALRAKLDRLKNLKH